LPCRTHLSPPADAAEQEDTRSARRKQRKTAMATDGDDGVEQ
jgi:hypothetical protein